MIEWKKSLSIVIVLIAIGLGLYQANQYLYRTECPIVNTTLGSLQGYTGLSRDGQEYFAYLGIPFGAPPIGTLRFEPPQPAEKWSGIRKAVTYGSNCAQMNGVMGVTGRIESIDEDCLFLNIFIPAKNFTNLRSTNRLSVMVFFYGGMFMEGKSSLYHPGYFMDEDIVLVTVNYRVGALGFLSTGDGTIRGNQGLKDQNLALRWIQDNIKFFNGNSKDVTIFGQSAGAASVHYHILSPMSHGLFAKGISLSGVATNPWALTPNPMEQAFRFGKFFNCPNDTIAKLTECIKHVPVEDILQTHMEILSVTRDLLSIYTPTVETIKDLNAFILEKPFDTLRSGKFNKVPWMTGVVAHEGLIISTMVVRNSSLVKGDVPALKSIARNGLFYSKDNTTLTDEVHQQYFGNIQSIAETGREKFVSNLTTMFSDRHFFTGFVHSILAHSKYAPTFPYFFNYTGGFTITNILLSAKGERNVLFEIALGVISQWFKSTFFGIQPEYHGISHSDDLFLIFDIIPPLTTIGTNHKNYKISRAMVKLWTSFAKQKFPAAYPSTLEFSETKWPPINPEEKTEEIKYLAIDNESNKLILLPFGSRLEFWNSRDKYI